MPRPRSADLRGRVPAARGRRDAGRGGIARRLRAAASTLHLRQGAARAGGRRGPEPRGGGRAATGGAAGVSAGPIAERNRADVAEGRAAWRAGPARAAPERPVLVDETGLARPPAGGTGPGGRPDDARPRPRDGQAARRPGSVGSGSPSSARSRPAAWSRS
jgi:hypothetical protein